MVKSLLLFLLFALVLILSASNPAAAQVPEDPETLETETPVGAEGLLAEIRQILDAAESPLTEEQIVALAPILEAASGEFPQRGAIIDQRVRETAGEVLTPEQASALQRSQAGRVLLEDGVEGLRAEMAAAGAPSLTFDQETQVRNVHDSHVRALNDLLEANGSNAVAVETQTRQIEEQLLLAALKFLNPVQRSAFVGSMAATDFASFNSDLPDDPAELQEYLDNLRSPGGDTNNRNSNNFSSGNFSGGGRGGGNFNGGNFNGGSGRGNFFGGGGTPNRDEIQEIRINENSFTAEQSDQSRGRTVIISRGGAGRFRGNFQFNFADESLDARNAFSDSRPPYQDRNFSGSFGGPVIRDRMSLTFNATRSFSEQGDNLNAATPTGFIRSAVVRPSESKNYSLNAIGQLSSNHVVNASVSTFSNVSDSDNIGQERLVEAGNSRDRSNLSYEIQETAVLSSAFNNEVRFSSSEFRNENRPLTIAPYLNVQGAFQGGGSTNDSDSTNQNMNFSDLLMYTGNRWAIRVGYDAGYRRQESDSRSNFNGTYTFSSLFDYCGAVDPNFLLAGCQLELSANPGATPQPADSFTRNEGDSFLEVSQFESATFIQTDWRTRPDLTLSFGLRYEWQGNLDDNNNLDPRFGFAYAVSPDVVLRGGTGIFHQRLDLNQIRDLLRFGGTQQTSLVIFNPSYPDPFLGGTAELAGSNSIRVHAEDLAAPYTWNNEISIETSLEGGLVLTGSYRWIRGMRLYRERNLNAPLPECIALMPSGLASDEKSEFARLCRPNPTFGTVTELGSTGSSSDHQIRIGWRQPLSFLSLNGSYQFSSNYTDTGDPANSYDQDAEWARSGERHRINTSLNVRLPWNINANTILNWSSGTPYSIRTGSDNNFDGNNNDRPLDPDRPGEFLPPNTQTGPGFVEVDLDLSKSVQLRSDRVLLAEGATGPVAGGGYYGQRTGLRMTISGQVSNLLNKVNFQNPSGVQTSPFFGLPTQARAARSVQMQVRFDF